ncbi:hypothetical protein ncot_12770 [Nocardioides sp. JQ2195]|uniref:hypothetical protein n=1 Tax=Nocardioides sp. JQ2195 TaxID=2592334 RepID=UPI00143EE861|nr:hypothetical protein [Nocardioides sp. JQ2195]QIX27377.1 hypothetical protein ncot_12770 [Nocardioides sp. JQ2195]
MIELVLGLAALAAIALALPTVVRRRCAPGRETSPPRKHLWAVAQANTSDGVTARLGVEFTAAIDDHGASTVIDAVEGLLRHEIAASAAHQLPSVGDALPDLDAGGAAGTGIDRVVVASSEIQVTPEFRRLVSARD